MSEVASERACGRNGSSHHRRLPRPVPPRGEGRGPSIPSLVTSGQGPEASRKRPDVIGDGMEG